MVDKPKRLHARADVSCEFATLTRAGARGYVVGAVESRRLEAALKPASPAVPTAAAEKQHYDYDDQKSCGVHTVLLTAYERNRGKCNPENQKGPSLVPEAAN